MDDKERKLLLAELLEEFTKHLFEENSTFWKPGVDRLLARAEELREEAKEDGR